MSRFAAPIALAVCLAAGLGGCETPTPYQPIVRGHTAAGGYSEVRLEPGRWRVSFSGNSLTSRETVDGYLLFRSAELTLQNGDDWFTLIDRDSRTTSHTFVEPDPFYRPWYGPGFGYWRPSWRFHRGGRSFGWGARDSFFDDPFFAGQYDARTLETYQASAEIVTHKGAKPADDPRAFDARGVTESLKGKIQYPAPQTPAPKPQA